MLYGKQAELFDYFLSLKDSDNLVSVSLSQYADNKGYLPTSVTDIKRRLVLKGFLSDVDVKGGHGHRENTYKVCPNKEKEFISFKERAKSNKTLSDKGQSIFPLIGKQKDFALLLYNNLVEGTLETTALSSSVIAKAINMTSSSLTNLISKMKHTNLLECQTQQVKHDAIRVFKLSQSLIDYLKISGNAKNKLTKKEQGYIYLIKCTGTGKLKIGWSEKSVDDRKKGLQTGNPFPLEILDFIKGNQKGEKALHDKFDHLHFRGEWFDNDTQIINCFKNEDVRFFIEMLAK